MTKSDLATSAAARLESVRERIGSLAVESGRESADVTLIAVSKGHEAEAIRPVLEAGQRVFGENKVQETQGKWPALKAGYEDIKLHLVGPLQTNKVRDALTLFHAIHSLDRPKLARKLAQFLGSVESFPTLFIQVNTGEEPQKSGVGPREADGFIALCRDELKLPVAGLMCVPPVDEEPALHFALLGKIARRNGLTQLSMGMSSDYETAIALGATYVRVGTAIFGPRISVG